MSTKQDRRDKAAKAGKAKAEVIIAEAYARVAANGEASTDAKEGWQRPEGCDAETWTLACAVRQQRDEGVAWWKIAHALGLPGSADNVAQGKSGAGFARKVYRAGFGEVPRTQRARGTGPKQNENVKALKRQPKAERVEMVKRGEPVISNSLTDEDIVEMVKGKHISWTMNLNDIDGNGDHFVNQEADVHRVMVRVELDKDGETRLLRFKEVDRSASIEWRETGLSTRIVRLASIHSVR